MEDQELEEAVADEDSSDEEGNTPVPVEWRNQEFLKLMVRLIGHRGSIMRTRCLMVLCTLLRSLLLI